MLSIVLRLVVFREHLLSQVAVITLLLVMNGFAQFNGVGVSVGASAPFLAAYRPGDQTHMYYTREKIFGNVIFDAFVCSTKNITGDGSGDYEWKFTIFYPADSNTTGTFEMNTKPVPLDTDDVAYSEAIEAITELVDKDVRLQRVSKRLCGWPVRFMSVSYRRSLTFESDSGAHFLEPAASMNMIDDSFNSPLFAVIDMSFRKMTVINQAPMAGEVTGVPIAVTRSICADVNWPRLGWVLAAFHGSALIIALAWREVVRRRWPGRSPPEPVASHG